jgi:hypothetical protein
MMFWVMPNHLDARFLVCNVLFMSLTAQPAASPTLNTCRAKDQLKRMVKAHQTAVMRLSAAELELQSAKAAAATALKQHMTRLQDKLQDRCDALQAQLPPIN